MTPRFSDKEYQEILRGRERLAKCKVKNYGYPEPLLEEPTTKPEEQLSNRQWDVITQLRLDQINLRKTLYNTLKEIKERASASKRKTLDTNKLNNIYRGTGSGNEDME